jgi:hypothetical protein
LKIYSRFVFLLLLLLSEKVLPIYHASITVTAWKEKTRDQKNITSILPEKKRKGKKHSIFLQENVLNPSNQDNMSSIQVTSTTWKNRKSKGENRETTRPKKLIAFLLARPKWK